MFQKIIKFVKKNKEAALLCTLPLLTFLILLIFLNLAYQSIPTGDSLKEFYYNCSMTFSGWFAAIIAYCGLIYASNTFRDTQKSMRYNISQNTANLILTLSADEKLWGAKINFFQTNAALLTELDDQERQELLYILNKYELMALGIRHKIWDENLCKDMQYSNVLKLWEKTSSLIDEIRRDTQRVTIYQDLEWLCKRWNSNPINKI